MNSTFLAILLLVTFSSFAQSNPGLLDHAQALRDSGLYKDALAEIDQLLIRDPKNPYYYDFRASVYFKLGVLDQAKSDYDKAVSLAPKEAMFYQHRSDFFISMQQPDLAMEDNERALQLVTKDTLKYALILNRGECYRMKRDFQNAYKDFMTALKFDSTSLAALNDIANVLGETGRSGEAVPYLQKVIRLYPDDVGGYVNLAFLYTGMGKYKEALELNNKVLEMDPTDALAYNNQGFVKYKMNDLKGAMEDVNHSLKLYPANSYAYKNRALIFIALKQYNYACDDLKKAITLGFTEMYGDEVQKLLEHYCTSNN